MLIILMFEKRLMLQNIGQNRKGDELLKFLKDNQSGNLIDFLREISTSDAQF